MKYLLTLVLTSAFIINAQEDVEYKHELEVNKAEYYIGTFNKGKKMLKILQIGMMNLLIGLKI